jgi:uncharacterized protein (TIGR03083 family)
MAADVPQAEQVRIELDPAAVLAAYPGHRRVFAGAVASLDETALATPSRCRGWSVADVLRHCRDVDSWMQALWAGKAPPFTSFDARTTPDEFVVADRSTPDTEVRDQYVWSAEQMAAEMEASGRDRWGVLSISPLGIVPWWLSALHIFYDSWVHQRDALLPLGVDVPVEPAEAVPVLTYSLAVVGTLISEPSDAVVGGIRLVTGAGPARATPVEPEACDREQVGVLIDALSGRGTLEAALTGVDPQVVHRLGALARYFVA